MTTAKEIPSFTKPVGTPGGERKHPKGDKIDYSKYEREHPHKDEGYKKVGSSAKDTTTYPTCDPRKGVCGSKGDATRTHPHTVTKPGGGYSQGGAAKGADARKALPPKRAR